MLLKLRMNYNFTNKMSMDHKWEIVEAFVSNLPVGRWNWWAERRADRQICTREPRTASHAFQSIYTITTERTAINGTRKSSRGCRQILKSL